MQIQTNTPLLQDTFGRNHGYLRISLVEQCNLRCTYCMPEEGVPLSPKSHIMTCDEIYQLAKLFVNYGVTKIRLTGGEPMIRKDIGAILSALSSLPVTLSISSNAVNIEQHIDVLKANGVKKINVSLDTLDREKFWEITRRDKFEQVYSNILLLIAEGFEVKLNAVLMKDVNDNEVIDFINWTKDLPISVRFIEFMPFDGNKWDRSKTVSYAEIMEQVSSNFTTQQVIRLKDAQNDTAKNYKIDGYKGNFGIISTVTNPFCDTCNRLRLTANGHLKNCLFSATEADLLTPLRAGEQIEPIIRQAVQAKLDIRGGMDTPKKLEEPLLHNQNRSMITIGG